MVHISREYFNTALEEECEKVREAVEGTRKNKLNKSAFKIFSLIARIELLYGDDYDVDLRGDAEFALTFAAQEAGLRSYDILRVIEYGMDAGLRHPRKFEEDASVSNQDILPTLIPTRKGIIVNSVHTVDTINTNSYAVQQALIEQKISDWPLPLSKFSANDRRALIYFRRAVMTGSPKVIGKYTCVVMSEVSKQSGISHNTLWVCRKRHEELRLLEVMDKSPPFKTKSHPGSPNRSCYLWLSDDVYTGEYHPIEEQVGQKRGTINDRTGSSSYGKTVS